MFNFFCVNSTDFPSKKLPVIIKELTINYCNWDNLELCQFKYLWLTNLGKLLKKEASLYRQPSHDGFPNEFNSRKTSEERRRRIQFSSPQIDQRVLDLQNHQQTIYLGSVSDIIGQKFFRRTPSVGYQSQVVLFHPFPGRRGDEEQGRVAGKGKGRRRPEQVFFRRGAEKRSEAVDKMAEDWLRSFRNIFHRGNYHQCNSFL